MEQARMAIMRSHARVEIERPQARLLERIKIETRMLLLDPPASITTASAARLRRDFVRGFRTIRAQRVPAHLLSNGGFYHEAATWGEAFALLILARKARTS